nr:metalloregulator ArsR/SmtB family transcription factor [uncultured Bacillus sp.]
MEQLKKTTKDRILELLKKEGLLSVNDLADFLTITHMAVRKHLSQLERDALIQTSELKQPVGRPLQLYSLSEKGERLFPKNYEGITLEFLHDLQEIYGKASIDLLFKKREERLFKELGTRLQPFALSEKVKELVKIQNEKGYMADFIQISPDSFELIEHNCPILAVAHAYPIACSYETEMLKKVLNAMDVQRQNCKTDGDHHCTFFIQYGEN